jgi:hypothetical protein
MHTAKKQWAVQGNCITHSYQWNNWQHTARDDEVVLAIGALNNVSEQHKVEQRASCVDMWHKTYKLHASHSEVISGQRWRTPVYEAWTRTWLKSEVFQTQTWLGLGRGRTRYTSVSAPLDDRFTDTVIKIKQLIKIKHKNRHCTNGGCST